MHHHHHLRRLTVAGAVVAAAALISIGGTGAPAQASGWGTVLSEGHVDVLAVAFEDGELELHVHDEETDTEYGPEEVTLRVLPGAEATVPSDPAFGFLGDPGDPVWILPQAGDPGLLFAGLATEEIAPGALIDDEVNLTVLGVIGPGDVAIYIENVLGLPDRVLLDSGDGTPDSFTLTADEHLHANWAFTAPGNYWWVVAATARVAGSNQFVTSGLSLYHFQVQG